MPSGWDGRIIDRRYKIVRLLGEGAMGSVFVAEHLNLHKQVAVKVVRSEYAKNRELLARFAREALAGSKIEHPSVVAALDYGALEEGGAYLVMPLVPGECLADVMERRGRLPWVEVAELGAQIADALAAAWAQGFVHRDLKPDNVLLEPRDHGGPLARVIDFGIAKLIDQLSGIGAAGHAAGQALTKEGTIIGTPGYMAPEQALGRAATHTADLYSLGVMLWEALAGEKRWQGDSVQAILRAQLKQARPSVKQATSDATIPAELDQLVERLVSVRPEQRPQDARHVRDELKEILRRHAPPARGAGKGMSGEQMPKRPWLVLFGTLTAGAALGGLLALAPEKASTGDPEQEAALRTLLQNTSAAARKKAAEQLLQERTAAALPAYAREAARLELAASCKEKKPALEALLKLKDARARPLLDRLSTQPKSGCGPSQKQDCLGCLRGDLQRALAATP